MTLVFALDAAFSKRSQVTCLSAPLSRYTKNELFEAFSPKFASDKSFYAIVAIEHAFLIHLHLLGPEGGVETRAFQL